MSSTATLQRPAVFKTFYCPFSKSNDEQQIVEGIASSEAVDSDGEVIESAAMEAALADYMKFANLREMHTMSAAGKVKIAVMQEDGKTWISAKVVDSEAWAKVKEKVYMGFSIGGRVTKREGKRITGLELYEISLVDRPANPEAMIEVWKRAAGDVTVMTEETGLALLQALDFHKANFKPTPNEGAAMAKEINKSLGHVGWLANLIDSLIWLYQNVEAEQLAEGDEASMVCDQLGSILVTLGETLMAMTSEEVAEEMKRLELEQVAKLAKGAKPTKEECYKEIDGMKEKLNAMHKAVSDAGDEDEALSKHMDHIKAIHKAHDDFGADDSTKEDAVSVATLKALKDLLAKREAKKAADLAAKAAGAATAAAAEGEVSEAETIMKAQVEALEGIASLTASIEELKKTIVPPKAQVQAALAKGQDDGAGGAAAAEIVEISRKMPEREREALAMKSVQKGLKIKYVD